MNEPSQRIQNSLCSADSPLLSSPQRLQQLVHGFPAAIRRLFFRELLYKITFLWRCCKCHAVFVTHAGLPCTPLTNTASVFHAWVPPTLKQRSPGRNVNGAQRSQLAFFSESNPAPRALLLFSSQGPTRKKQRGRGSQHSEMSELMLVVPLRTSLSPHREFSPVLFTRSDQHPSAAASNLVLFGGSNDGEIGTCHWRFQMRRSCWARTTIYPGDWFFSLDLKDAYFYVQIAPYHRQFLRFAFEGVAYQYTVLPFGLSLAPSLLRSA